MTASRRGGFAPWSAEPPADTDDDRDTAVDGVDRDYTATTRATGVTRHAEDGNASLWQQFRSWRRSRPFWGAFFALLAGAEILLTEIAPFGIIIHMGTRGLLGYAVPILMMLCGLMLWFAPHPRAFYASLILLLSLASFLTTNLGGFILGMLLGLLGGSLAISWAPGERQRSKAAHAAEGSD